MFVWQSILCFALTRHNCVHAGQRIGVKTGQRASPLSGGRTASRFETALESLSETLGDARHRHALQRLIDAGLGEDISPCKLFIPWCMFPCSHDVCSFLCRDSEIRACLRFCTVTVNLPSSRKSTSQKCRPLSMRSHNHGGSTTFACCLRLAAAVGAVTSEPREENKAFAVVLAAGSQEGMQVIRNVARLCTDHAALGQTVSAATALAKVTAESPSADRRVALSEIVAQVVQRSSDATVVLDETVFAQIDGALTSFHTCWDSRGKIEGPTTAVSCTRATFVVVIDMRELPHSRFKTGDECKTHGPCPPYDAHLVKAKASYTFVTPSDCAECFAFG